MRTLDQIRAKYAWGRVQGPDEKYRNLAKSLPALVMTNGLMQTLAFLKGKGKPEHNRLTEDILTWLADPEVRILPTSNYERAMTFMVNETNSDDYQKATEETLAVLKWIRYLAQTVPPVSGQLSH
jgi:CRISPR-associated protein Cmr5